MKQPIVKLIEILNECNSGVLIESSSLKEEITKYLEGCGCCAFCMNKGKHDPCDELEVAAQDFRVFNPEYGCSYFRDARIYDDRYKPANGGSLDDFYKDVMTGLEEDEDE